MAEENTDAGRIVIGFNPKDYERYLAASRGESFDIRANIVDASRLYALLRPAVRADQWEEITTELAHVLREAVHRAGNALMIVAEGPVTIEKPKEG